MSFGGGGFSGFGQQNQQSSGGFGGFGSQPSTSGAFGSTSGGFGSTPAQSSGGGLFGSSSTGGGFGTTSGGFGSGTGGGFGAKPAFGSTTTTAGGGLFGSSTTATAGGTGFGSGGFGSNTASSSTPFGGGGGSSMFGGNKPATTFGAGTTGTTGSSLFGGGATGGFGSGSTGFGATSNPGIGTNVGEPPGTAQVQFQPTVEKEANNPSQSNSFQNILFMEPYKKWSAEELRLADYNQGRRHGNASGSTGAFGVSSGFGSGGFGSTGSGFGSTNTGTTGGGGLFGSTQPASTGFGQAATTGSGFGSGTSGGLFGQQNKPATGLFGSTSQPQQPGGLFGSASTGGGGFGSTSTGNAFGSGANTASTGGGLFGSGTTQAKPSSSFSFGTGGAQTGFGGAGTTGGFGSTTGTATGTGGGLFGGGGSQTTGSGLFGGSTQAGTGSGFGGGFGGQGQQQQQQQQQGGGLFGNAQQQKPGGLFGNAGNTNTGGGLFGNANQAQSAFGGGQTAQPSGGLFGNKPAGSTGGGLFGSATATQTGATGGGLFGGLGGAAQTQQQPAAQPGGLFGASQAKPSLFGGSTQSTGGGLFGAQTAQPQSLFGNTATQQQPQATNPLFGASQGAQNTPQSLTTSINDVSAFGTPSLFQGLGAGEVRDPGPLATPLSGSTTKTPRRGSILPLYKLNPGSASKFVTPSKRGFGFSYSNFGTPTSPSSVASTPGGFGQSLLMGSTRGLSKSISSSSLRRSFNPEDSILAPGAFSSTSGPKYHTGTGSVKRLVINREIRSDLFSTPNKEKQPAELLNGSRKLSKRVSFDTSTVPAIENGVAGGEAVEESAQDLGFIRPSSRTSNNANGSRPSSSDANPEMEQVKGNELAIVHEEGSPTVTKSVEPPKINGEYWMRPSMEEINAMNRMQRQQVSDFTVGRKGIGQIRFKVPVDLSNINIEDIPGGIVLLETRSATVYPVAAKKPPMGKGLNVPSEISLEHSWPRGRVHEKSGPRVAKHVERLKKIDNTTFINYDADTGVWTFTVEHFTTYGLDYDEDEEETEPQADTQEREDLPVLPPHQPVQTFVAPPEVDDDDTFEFRRNRRAVPGAFDDEAMSDDEIVPQKQSFLSSGSAEYVSARSVVPVIADDEEMDHGDVALENEDMAISTFQPHHPAEPQATSPQLGSTVVPDTPAGIVRARMRAIKESATPLKLQVAGGDDWMDMLRRTVSPQKRDRAALRALNDVELNGPGVQEKAPVVRNRLVSDGRGFATSIDLMNSLFEKAKAPVQPTQTITPATGFMKWPYKRQSKQPENEADMDPKDRSFHDSFKPSWAPDGAFLVRNNKLNGFSDGVGVVKSSAFTGDFPIENPLEGIADHRDLVDIHVVNGVPTVSTQRVPNLKAFSTFSSAAKRKQSDRLDSISRNIDSYERSVWELASVLFDPVDHAVSAVEEKRIRKVNLAKFWRGVVQDAFAKNLDRAFTAEEKAIAYLSANKVAEACKQLSDGKDLKLATLVALIGTSDAVQKDMKEQMEEWHDGDVLSEFSLAIRAIYSLLGGSVTECKGKKGVGVENRLDTENIAERFGLNWKQAFGLRLWYGISSKDDITVAVDKFLDDVEHGSVPAPQPWYVEQGLQAGYEDNNLNRREDLLWGLLKVFAGRAKLEDILQPENSQLAPFNYRLCWQLSQALGAKNKHLFGDKAEAKADALTVSFATEVLYYQKEGSWVAAIWVLLHLSDPAARAKAVQDVLNRNAAALFTRESREHNYHDRIVEDMKIPPAWFWQAAALHWRSRQDRPALEARCLLKARAFADAHKIFARELAPRAVVARDYADAVAMLVRFQPHRQAIPDWALGGEVYGHFFELLAERAAAGGSIGGGQSSRASASSAPRLVEALMASLPAMYEACGESDTTEVAAITEMADVVAGEAIELAGKGRMDLSKISRLPLTEDRHLRYSNDLASAYYREVMSARG